MLAATLIASVLVLAGMGLLFGVGLALAGRLLAVPVDPRVERVTGLLPGINCGSCGYPGCSAFAEALLRQEASPSSCPVNSREARNLLFVELGLEASETRPMTAVLKCRGGRGSSKDLFEYQGLQDCRAAARLYNGSKECVSGCLGLGSCIRVCPLGAIRPGEEGLPEFDYDKCGGCGLCVAACPRGVIILAPADALTHVHCASTEPGRLLRHICTVGCIKCRKCRKVCQANAISFDSGCAVIDYELCSGCGDCVPVCPTHSILLRPAAPVANPSTDI